MKHILLIVCCVIFFTIAYFGRYRPVSLDLVQPTTKEVEIKGEVNQPGVYTLKWDGNLKDLVNKAGGFTDQADTESISLVQDVKDKQVIVIGKIDEKQEEKISINSASAEQLQTIPGIGPAMATRIIEYRQTKSFDTLEELKEVKGIGDKLYEKMLPYIVL